MLVWLQQTKARYEIEAEKRELARLLERRTQEVENLTGNVRFTSVSLIQSLIEQSTSVTFELLQRM